MKKFSGKINFPCEEHYFFRFYNSSSDILYNNFVFFYFFLRLVTIIFCSTAFEELSVRSNIALAQKKIVNDLSIDSDNAGTAEDFEREYLTMSAQVVRNVFFTS